MAAEGEADQAALLRGILENMAANELARGGVSADNVAQLLAAAIAQVGQGMASTQQQSEEATAVALQESSFNSGSENIEFNPSYSREEQLASEAAPVGGDPVTPASQQRPKPICVKFPTDLRLKIIAMRKAGSKCKEIAKELKVSVSGVKKVWERFLATGMVHDRKPSTYAGRPKKYIFSEEAPVTPSLETQYLGDGEIEVFQTGSGKVEYVTTTTSEAAPSSPLTPHTTTPLCADEAEMDTMIIADDNEVFSDGPLGATVEIVDTPTPTNFTPRGAQRGRKKAPVYRGQLLMRLVEDCPLAVLKETTVAAQNPHLQNLQASVDKPLYMEYVLGHPFGKVPSPKPFESNLEEAKVILSDPSVPIGKEVLAALGYSTKVYFNACCKPSPLFASQKVLASLPLSLGPGHMAETMAAVLQLLLSLCQHPVEAMVRLPVFVGPAVSVYASEGGVTASHAIPTPTKLSEFWKQLYGYSQLLECCENFLSASPPSAPCLLCHPFESFAQKLEVKDVSPCSTPITPLPPSHPQSHTEKELPPPEPFPLKPAPLGSKKAPPQPDSNSSIPSSSIAALSEAIPLPVTVVASSVSDAALAEDGLSTTSEKTDKEETPSPKKLRRSARITKTLDSTNATPQASTSPKTCFQESSPPETLGLPAASPPLPPAKRTRRAVVAYAVARATGRECGGKHPGQWSVEEVADFVTKIPHCNFTETFREHEVDGESLLSLDPEIMVKLMQLKTGPALRIHRHIIALKQQFGVS